MKESVEELLARFDERQARKNRERKGDGQRLSTARGKLRVPRAGHEGIREDAREGRFRSEPGYL